MISKFTAHKKRFLESFTGTSTRIKVERQLNLLLDLHKKELLDMKPKQIKSVAKIAEVQTVVYDTVQNTFLKKYGSKNFETSAQIILNDKSLSGYDQALGIVRISKLFPGWHSINCVTNNVDIFTNFMVFAEGHTEIVFDDERGDQFFRYEGTGTEDI